VEIKLILNKMIRRKCIPNGPYVSFILVHSKNVIDKLNKRKTIISSRKATLSALKVPSRGDYCFELI
jgi:hypothetical protein